MQWEAPEGIPSGLLCDKTDLLLNNHSGGWMRTGTWRKKKETRPPVRGLSSSPGGGRLWLGPGWGQRGLWGVGGFQTQCQCRAQNCCERWQVRSPQGLFMLRHSECYPNAVVLTVELSVEICLGCTVTVTGPWVWGASSYEPIIWGTQKKSLPCLLKFLVRISLLPWEILCFANGITLPARKQPITAESSVANWRKSGGLFISTLYLVANGISQLLEEVKGYRAPPPNNSISRACLRPVLPHMQTFISKQRQKWSLDQICKLNGAPVSYHLATQKHLAWKALLDRDVTLFHGRIQFI